ncbi:glycosyltransferase family 2 protein [Agrobacterium pusense]|uniref:glycosyltransferase family 2 protein n=1 Tax=Agrobacterium pusense TaxID=648995 RepID=UPI001572DBE4|nr:glycosyltransferase family 2 protein [Agrobacterium pusense]NTE45482.1 glycosyltransferase [Agrobacterium pusense]
MDYLRHYTRESFRTTPAGRKIVFSRIRDNPPQTVPDRGEAGHMRFLRGLGFGKPYINACERLALENGSTLEAELLAGGFVATDAYFGAFARFLRLPFVAEIDPDRVADVHRLDTQLAEPRLLRLTPANGKPALLIVPELARMELLKSLLDRHPHLLDELVVTTPHAMRDAIWKAGETRRCREARQQLFNTAPQYSARITLQGHQGFYSGIVVTLLTLSLLFHTQTAMAVIHVALTMLYFFTLLFRLFVLMQTSGEKDTTTAAALEPDGNLPVYTILVALYREDAIVSQLIGALERLDWPKSRLDIKLVCEADDGATIDAILRLNPGKHIEIVRVPPSLPRTKPKALTYALSGARGAFVAIYDAEDRPHPLQLREAYATFRHQPENVACLQAPLIISNARSSWISACFALEYAGLFRSMLPVLAAHRLPLPLGGTSNHFRTAVLRRVGAWDPYNVTEDADIGLRLHQLGYRCGVIYRQTLEDAPATLPVWLNQRARWYKGWLQSWLVMTRAPVATARRMGWLSYIVFQLLIGGMLVSSMAHPLLFVSVAWMATAIGDSGADMLFSWQGVLFLTDTLNIAGSYAIFVLMGRNRMIDYERRQVGKRWLAIPLYWLILSLAAWRAVLELKTKPFVWNKTPHVPSVSNTT